MSGGMDSLPGVDIEENKAMYDGQDVMTMGLADNAMNGEDGVCQKCNSHRPPPEVAKDFDTLTVAMWVGCDKCESWFHAVCVHDKLAKMGITKCTHEILEKTNFICCDTA